MRICKIVVVVFFGREKRQGTRSNQKKIIYKNRNEVYTQQSSILAQFHTKQKCPKNTCAIP